MSCPFDWVLLRLAMSSRQQQDSCIAVNMDLLGARFKTCEASQVVVPCFDLNKSKNFDGS